MRGKPAFRFPDRRLPLPRERPEKSQARNASAFSRNRFRRSLQGIDPWREEGKCHASYRRRGNGRKQFCRCQRPSGIVFTDFPSRKRPFRITSPSNESSEEAVGSHFPNERSARSDPGNEILRASLSFRRIWKSDAKKITRFRRRFEGREGDIVIERKERRVHRLSSGLEIADTGLSMSISGEFPGRNPWVLAARGRGSDR